MDHTPAFDHLFLGAGAMKAGTTWLYRLLDSHPDVFFSLEKEIHYFYARYVDRNVLRDQVRLENVRSKYLRIDPATSSAEAVRKRLRWSAAYLDGPLDDDWYRGLFQFRRAERYVSDFSNLYALLPAEAWSKIANRTEHLRVLYTMRDPIKRLLTGDFEMKFHVAPKALDGVAHRVQNPQMFGAVCL
ncbi:MAG: sulfotransferase [Pseudomonadota bacterium]